MNGLVISATPQNSIEKFIEDEIDKFEDSVDSPFDTKIKDFHRFLDTVIVTGTTSTLKDNTIFIIPFIVTIKFSNFSHPIIDKIRFFPTDGSAGDATDVAGETFATGFADAGGDTPFHAFLFDDETDEFQDLGALSDIGFRADSVHSGS